MKKIKILALVFAIAQTLVLSSCFGTEEDVSSLTSSDAGASSAITSDVSSQDVTTDVSSAESEVSSEESEEPSSSEQSKEDNDGVSSENVSSEPVVSDDGFMLLDLLSKEQLADFSNSAFVGNSIIHGFNTYGAVPDADFYAYTSINVSTVYTKEIDYLGKKTIMEAIDSEECGKLYDNIFILLGINEIGMSHSVVADRYAKIIRDLKVIQPNANIYVLSVFPVTEKRENDEYKKENDDKDDTSAIFIMENIDSLNGHLRDMCTEEGVTFFNVNGCLKNDKGYLSTSIAAGDGIHIKKRGCQHIAAFIHSMIFPNTEI